MEYGKQLKTYFLYLTLFITGAVVLIVEISGTRILAPFYGSTIYVWSSLITVTMACLALGYYWGGRLADKYPDFRILYLIIFLTGLIILIIPKIDGLVLLWSYGLGTKWGSLLASFLLFSLPLTALGMISPLAIKLKTKFLDSLGTIAGNLYAISTVGSLVGALLAGFWLIPNFGIASIINFSGSALLIISIIWLVVNQRFSKSFISGIALIVGDKY